MAVYGEMLSYFPELFQLVDYFSMNPQPVASYDERKDLGKVKGVFQFIRKGELARSGDTLSEKEVPTFWTTKKLEVGNFITVDEIDYRIDSNDDWMFAGGYYCYGLETLIGNTDKQEEIPDVDLGIGSYA